MWHCAWSIDIKQILSRYGILDDRSPSSCMHHAIAKTYMFSWVPTMPPYDWTWKELRDDQLISLQRREHSDWQHNTNKSPSIKSSNQLASPMVHARTNTILKSDERDWHPSPWSLSQIFLKWTLWKCGNLHKPPDSFFFGVEYQQLCWWAWMQ